MEQRNKNKNALIGGLLAIVFVMAVGYAAFATQLNISGTANITSNWDVHIQNVEATNTVGTATSKSITPDFANLPEGTKTLTASFETDLVAPGDAITYTVTVKNGGTLDAKLSDIVFNFTTTETNAIEYSYSGIAKNDTLAAGADKSFTVTVKYKDSITTQPADADKTNELTMTLTYVQNTTEAAE
ncbi:MAG: DUF11 domain-containing protein [Bacilli bacterium]|nr:DUF11 domain-containing protein [Bacilli bacterium]